MQKKYPRKLWLLLLASVAVSLIAIPGISGNTEDEKTTTAPESETNSQDQVTGVSGLNAATDEEGNLRPLTVEESKELDKQLKKTLAKYKKHGPKKNDQGAISLITAPHSVELTILTDGPEGDTVHCLSAEELAAAAAKTEKAEEE
jgi:hypothetical protein